MSLQALLFLLIFVIGSILALKKGPFYGLLTYMHIYFNIPSHQYWGDQVPDLRWSFTSAGILILSVVLHRSNLSELSVNKQLTFKLLIGYLILVIMTSFWSPFPDDAYSGIYDFLRYVVIFYLMAKIISTEKQYEWVIAFFVAEVFNLSLFARSKFHGGRLDGVGTADAGDANLFAGLLAITIFLMLGIIIYGHKYMRIAALVSLPFILNAFMMCGSRGGFLSLAISGILAATVFWNFSKGRWKKWQLIAAGMIAVILFVRLMSADFLERVQSIFDKKTGGWEEVSAGRTEIWQAGLMMAKENPFGYGTKGFINLSAKYLPEEWIEQSVGHRASHNTLILALVEQGVVGMLLYVLYFIHTMRIVGRARRKLLVLDPQLSLKEKRKARGFIVHCIGLEAAIVCLLVQSVFIDRLYFEVLYWLGALAISLSYIIDKKILDFQIAKDRPT